MKFSSLIKNKKKQEEEYLALLEDPVEFWNRYEFEMPNWYHEGWEPSN